jgi:hypothetical protein
MKCYIADYRTYVRDCEYLERGVLSSRSYETAKKPAVKDMKFFTRYEWEEFCQFAGIHEIPKFDFEVLKNM